MKAFLSLLLTAAIALGHFLANAQEDSYEYWEQGVSGEWVDALHAGPGYAGPEDEHQAPPYPYEHSLAQSDGLIPEVINFDVVHRKITLSYARNPEALQGIYFFEVFINTAGNVEDCKGDQPALFPFVRQLQFEKTVKPIWLNVVFDFGQIQ